MKKIISLLLLSIIPLSVLGQENITEELRDLYFKEKYQEVIDTYSDKTEELSAQSVYYVAMAYYMKADDNNCLKYMDISIKKDPTDSDAYYIKGMTYNYMGEFQKGIVEFNKAIKLHAKSGDYYTGLGDSYYNLKDLDKALESYTKATEQEGAPDRPFIKLGDIYDEQNKRDLALKAFYNAKAHVSKSSKSYANTLFNIGMYEALLGHFDKAEPIYKELLEINPKDYHTVAKLIQVYYGKKEYEKTSKLKNELYQAHKNGELKKHMKDMFCFDQFKWKDKHIKVFERFEEPEGELYYKHLFYIIDESGEIEFRIQTENSVISVELGGPKYLLGMSKGDMHSTFDFGFDEPVNYDDLKKAVINILEEKTEPVASSKPSK